MMRTVRLSDMSYCQLQVEVGQESKFPLCQHSIHPGLWSQTAWVQIPAREFPPCETLGNSDSPVLPFLNTLFFFLSLAILSISDANGED